MRVDGAAQGATCRRKCGTDEIDDLMILEKSLRKGVI